MSSSEEDGSSSQTLDITLDSPRLPEESSDVEEPPLKLMRESSASPVSDKGTPDKTLEDRLNGILCCAVCLDLPKKVIYQCTNGHLMCAPCFTHLLADARIRDESATCPGCRIEISKTSVVRNLAVEKAASELSEACKYCSLLIPRNIMVHHSKEKCTMRPVVCRYSLIGCLWRGGYEERERHEMSCPHPDYTGSIILNLLQNIEKKNIDLIKSYENILELLSNQKSSTNDIQLKPHRTDEFIHKLYYESSRFNGFSCQWTVKANLISSDNGDPVLNCNRQITYQICMKNKCVKPLTINYMLLRGPNGEYELNTVIHKFTFTDSEMESKPVPLELKEEHDCNKFISSKVINIRLVMFTAFNTQGGT